jgi:hypothetical protein
LYYSPKIVRVNKSGITLAGHVTRMEIRNAYVIFVEKSEGNISLGRLGRRWKYIFK